MPRGGLGRGCCGASKSWVARLEVCDGSLVRAWVKQVWLSASRSGEDRRSHPHLNMSTTKQLERGVAASTKPHSACSDHPGTAKLLSICLRNAKAFSADSSAEEGGGMQPFPSAHPVYNDIILLGHLACAQSKGKPLTHVRHGRSLAWLVLSLQRQAQTAPAMRLCGPHTYNASCASANLL